MTAQHFEEDIIGIQHQDYSVPSLIPDNSNPPIEDDESLFAFFNYEFPNEGLQPVTPHISHAARGSGVHENGAEDSEDDDLGPSSEVIDLDDEQELEERGFGDEEEVHIASDSHKWKIDHSKGEHRLAGMPLSSQAW